MNTEQQLRENCIKQLREKIKPLNWYLPYAQLEEKIISAMIDFHKQELSRLREIYVPVSVDEELPEERDVFIVEIRGKYDGKSWYRSDYLEFISGHWYDLQEHERVTHWLKKLSLSNVGEKDVTDKIS